MSSEYRTALREAIENHPARRSIVSSVTDKKITYNPAGVRVDPSAPGFNGTATSVTDEELVRAYLLLKLVSDKVTPRHTRFLKWSACTDPSAVPQAKAGG